jgi:thiosulfate dehydrogenase (quinone) large subunit
MKTNIESTKESELGGMPRWRLKGIGLIRILFGIVWGVDAWFKWQPSFISGFAGYLSGAQEGQPLLLHHWIVFWTNTIGIDPTLFAYATAVAETAIAIALIVGAFTNLTFVVGVLLSFAIWTTAEGFGGPYGAGSTDIGAAILYPLVFAGLFLSSAGLYYGVDRKLTAALGRFGYLASGGFIRKAAKAPIGRAIAAN